MTQLTKFQAFPPLIHVCAYLHMYILGYGTVWLCVRSLTEQRQRELDVCFTVSTELSMMGMAPGTSGRTESAESGQRPSHTSSK